ncbi:V-set and transmembrane domain-containing protein 2-like protein [Denticeps clupeoides]|uniref:V-set and transmembrane domain-containing protein 2-like protein n=1 Tax=Denticeps clupeoides TaxID=299321 RepID=A0AAY4ESX8_9TELE|nr:V-set and transmembrane domain-containing protein 2-like protein [Denticeps clupeoides]
MGAFGVLLGILHYAGLYVQVGAASRPAGDAEVDNHISGNALFTEVPHDMVTESGQDVEMACSFRGAGSPSVSLEIQWWYIRNHRKWTEKPAWTTNQVVPKEEMVKDATKISVVKVAGSNISHKLRLSSVKTSDEGTYECRVIDFSDSHAQHHRVRAYLQVQPPSDQMSRGPHDEHLNEAHENHQPYPDHPLHHGDHQSHKENHHLHPPDQLHKGDKKLQHGDQLHKDHRLHGGDHHEKEGEPAHSQQSEGKEMKRRSAEEPSDCTTDGCGH